MMMEANLDHLINCLVELAESPSIEEKVKRVVNLIPALPVKEKAKASTKISIRSQAYLRALGLFLFKSKGKCSSIILPSILPTLELFTVIGESARYEQFSRDISVYLLKAASTNSTIASRIIPAVLHALEEIISRVLHDDWIVSVMSCGTLFGFLRALGGSSWDDKMRLPIIGAAAERLIGLIESLLDKIKLMNPSRSSSVENGTSQNTQNHSSKNIMRLRATSLRVLSSLISSAVRNRTSSSMDPNPLVKRAYKMAQAAWDVSALMPVTVSILVIIGSKAKSLKRPLFRQLSSKLQQASCQSPIPSSVITALMRGLADLCNYYPDLAPSTMAEFKSLLLSPPEVNANTNATGCISGGAISAVRNSDDFDSAVAILCDIVRQESQGRVSYYSSGTRVLIMSLSNVLYDIKNEDLFDPAYIDTLIEMLSRVAEAANLPEVTKNVGSILIDNFARTFKSSSAKRHPGSLISALTTLASLTSQQDEYTVIMDLFVDCYRRWDCPSPAQQLMPDAFDTLSQTLVDDLCREDFTRRLLVLFSALGMDIQAKSNSNNNVSSMAGILGLLLTPLSRMPTFFNPNIFEADYKFKVVDQHLMKYFRNIWFFLVIMQMADETKWPSEWFVAVKKIAARSPALIISTNTDDYLDKQLEFNQILRKGTTDRNLGDLKKTISKFLPKYAASITSLSFHSTVYVMSVYHVETLRAIELGTFKSMFLYLQDDSIEKSEMSGAIEGVANEVFNFFVQGILTQEHDTVRETVLEDHTQFLLVHTLHRFDRVRSAALRYLQVLVSRFPAIQWGGSSLKTLLEVVKVAATHAGSRGPEYACDPSHSQTRLTSCPYSADLPKSPDSVGVIMKTVVTFACKWLEDAKVRAPGETLMLLQDFGSDIAKHTLPYFDHVGASLALHTTTKPRDHQSNLTTELHQAGGSQFTGASACKSHFLGEIAGMEAVFNYNASSKNLLPIRDMLVQYFYSLEESGQGRNQPLMSDGSSTASKSTVPGLGGVLSEGSDDDQHISSTFNEFEELFAVNLFRIAALLIISSQRGDSSISNDDTLIQLLCRSPARIFTESSMRAGVFAWKWVLSAMPHSRQRIMHEISNIWSWTVSRGYGLFSSKSCGSLEFEDWVAHADRNAMYEPPPIYTGPRSIPGCSLDGTIPDSFRNHIPHRIWITFFEERFAASRGRSVAEIELIGLCLSKALVDPYVIVGSVTAFGTVLTLLHLLMRILQESSNYTGRTINFNRERLRNRIYNASLLWFAGPLTFYEAKTSRIVLEQDFAILLSFAELIHRDLNVYINQRKQKNIASNGALKPNLSHTPRSGTPVVLGSNTANIHPTLPSPRQQSIGIRSVVSTTSHSKRSQHNFDAVSVASFDSIATNLLSSKSTAASLRSRRSLLLLIIGSEVDRLVSWNNPADKPNRRITGSIKYSLRAKGVISRDQWNSAAKTAWKVDPKLAVHLVDRFKSNSFSNCVRKFIRNNPKLCKNIPEAVTLFLSDESLPRRNEVLSELLYWAPCSCTDLLGLMSRIFPSHQSKSPLFCNMEVMQYCIRCLSQYPPQTLNFFLPQLVQALRYDYYGLLKDFLFSTSQVSMLVAHQLLWLLLTESETEVESEHDTKPSSSGLTGAPLSHGFLGSLPGKDSLPDIVKELSQRITHTFDGRALALYKEEFDFFEAVTSISGKLKEYPKEDRKAAIKDLLTTDVTFTKNNNLYLPTSPFDKIVDIDYESGTPMQSAAKCPFLLMFTVHRYPGPDSSLRELISDGLSKNENESRSKSSNSNSNELNNKIESQDAPKSHLVIKKACIFKVFDDCRQDVLALQVIQLCKSVYESIGLDIPLFPYRVIASRSVLCKNAIGGMIEVVPNCESRDGLGKKGSTTLFQHYQNVYGRADGESFEQARRKFVRSLAAYAVVCFILWIKDRHNGNLLIDDQGHVIHIDFGFLLGISPGGNMGFENAAFKLSPEMGELLGGQDTEIFQEFLEMSIRGFLAARRHSSAIINIVSAMADSGLPCYIATTMKGLRERLVPDKNEFEAAQFMKEKVYDAYGKVSLYCFILLSGSLRISR